MITDNIMIDLETMGTDPYSPVVAIGAVRFKMYNSGVIDPTTWGTFYQQITLQSCMEAGLKPSASTIEWWLTSEGVSQQARDQTFTGDNRVKLVDALDAFTEWHNSGTDTLWGNSARFDLGLLSDCYRVLGKPVPWLHYHEGCYRTMKNLPAVQHIKLRRTGTHHNALDDALSQAMHLCEIVNHLGANAELQTPTESN